MIKVSGKGRACIPEGLIRSKMFKLTSLFSKEYFKSQYSISLRYSLCTIYISMQKQPSCEKRYDLPKSQGEKRCEIKGAGNQEMTVMVGLRQKF